MINGKWKTVCPNVALFCGVMRRAQKSRARDKDYWAMTLLDFETCRTVEGGEYSFLDFFEVYKTSSLERAEWCIDLLCNENNK
uniref:Uncharacterized protein n=1 Tax=Tanacetum cinerariifolium TaxID=118510 RepID=A0A699R1C6_TANCI|nr:hypothetical protein [Tanacetum cinerariifolium]